MAPRLMAKSERRRAIRVAEKLPLAVKDNGLEVLTETKNLSTSGAYCTLNRFIPPMSKLQLRLEVPDGKHLLTIRCAGVVVRVEPMVLNAEQGKYNTAVFFTDLAERDRLAIARFVNQRVTSTPSSQ